MGNNVSFLQGERNEDQRNEDQRKKKEEEDKKKEEDEKHYKALKKSWNRQSKRSYRAAAAVRDTDPELSQKLEEEGDLYAAKRDGLVITREDEVRFRGFVPKPKGLLQLYFEGLSELFDGNEDTKSAIEAKKKKKESGESSDSSD